MGNSGSSQSPSSGGACKSCNKCSEQGLYFSFGKTDDKLYAIIKGKQRRVYVDKKGKYYKEGSTRRSLPSGTRTYKVKKSKIKSPKRKVPKNYYLKKTVKSPLYKSVKDTKKRQVGKRLSARAVFNEMGMNAVGRSFSILQKDGSHKMKVLRLRQNGSPYFANKFGNRHLMHNHRTFGKHVESCKASNLSHLNMPVNKNWLRGSPMEDMTGLKYSYPSALLAPGGVAQPHKMSILPRMARRSYFGA